LPDANRLAIADLHCGKIVRADLDHSDIRLLVGADRFCLKLATVL
jgi:hypothetical protein